MQALGDDLGDANQSRIHLDSTATKSFANRRGLDIVRNIGVNILWVQDQVARNRLPLCKVLETSNPAHLMTNDVSPAQLLTCIDLRGMEFREGLAEQAAELYAVVKRSASNTLDVSQQTQRQHTHTRQDHIHTTCE